MPVCVKQLSSKSTRTSLLIKRVSQFQPFQPTVVKVDVLNKIIDSNGENFKRIKASLAIMKLDIKECETTQKKEPETRVKKTIHHTFTQKFRDVLRTSQAIQMEFKNAVASRIKRQIRIAKPEVSEDELESLARDPDAAQKVFNEQILGKAHSKVKNTVSDIQKKYEAIKKLEEVSFFCVV